MAIGVMNWVLEDAPDVQAPLFAVLMALASKAREDGTGAWPSQKWLAERARKSERSVRNDLARLEKLKLIRRGDQSLTAHLPADKRPVVWDLATDRKQDSGGKHTSGGKQTTGSDERDHEDAGESTATGSRIPGGSTLPGGSFEQTDRKHASGREGKPASGDTSLDTSVNISPPSGESAPAPADSSKPKFKSTPSKRGTRIPADFAATVTAEMVAWVRAECPDVDGRDQTDRFVDYWGDKTGKDATKIDWLGTWRNWMRREQDKITRLAANGRASPNSRYAPGSGSEVPHRNAYDAEKLI